MREPHARPFIFIATNRLRAGGFAAEQQRVPGVSRFIEANEPRLIAFNEYANEDHSEVTSGPGPSGRCLPGIPHGHYR
jgi:hypothetical protein